MLKNIIKALAMVVLSGYFAFAGEPARIEVFSLQGTVKNVRQVAARFSEQMVSFGDPRLSDPFDVQCIAKGKGRWADGNMWSYDFEKDLPAGETCEFTLKSSMKTLAGNTITGQQKFSFNTGGPSVKSSRPPEGDTEIDERQVFIFSLDTAPDEASVSRNVYCSVQGIQERVGIKLITGEEKDAFFKAIKYRKEKAPNVAFQCKQAFPPRSEVKVIWGKGVRSKSGLSITEDQTIAFKTRDSFTARVQCMKERPNTNCIPIMPIELLFTSPISWDIAKQITLKNEKGKLWKPEGREGYVRGIIFKGPFPEKTGFVIDLPKHLRDDAERPLANQDKFPLRIKTDAYPALAKFSSRFGIIELNEGALLPLTVRNIEAEIKAWMTRAGEKQEKAKGKIQEKVLDSALNTDEFIKSIAPDSAKGLIGEVNQSIKGKLKQIQTDKEESVIEWLRTLKSAGREKPVLKENDRAEKFTIPKPGGSKVFEVIGIPLKGPGFYVVELESKILGSRLLDKPAPMYVQAAALVTNLSAHFKWGRESSLVWVTTLDKGEPVKDASVSIRDCAGKIVWQGKTNETGIAPINAALPPADKLSRCSDQGAVEEFTSALAGIRGGLFVFAKTGKDMTFSHSSWDEGIEPWRFNVSTGYESDGENVLAHTVFDRTLLRAGETVHMKHFVRERKMSGLFIPAGTEKLDEAVIEHTGSNQQYLFPLKWRSNGTAETTFKIPDSAKLGTYEVYARNKAGSSKSRYTGSLITGTFRVEEFRVPLMKGIIQGPEEPLVNAKETEVDISVSYLSGGGASNLPVKLRTEIRPKPISFPDYEDFTFTNGRVKTGIVKYEDYEDEDYEDEAEPRQQTKKSKLQTLEMTLDKQGVTRTKLSGFPEADTARDILAELEFRDPNGEVQTVSSRIPYYPSRLLVGISPGDRTIAQDSLKYRIIVVDLKGNPIPNAEVKTGIFQKRTYSHRKRITGGFYAFENVTEIKEMGEHCKGKTDQRGILYCQGKSPITGSVILQAEIADNRNNLSFANSQVWVMGKRDQWSEPRNDDRIDVIPDKRHYESGEQARFQIMMPFTDATALITVEREGVIDTYVKKLNRNMPFVEIPVKENYVPNVFVSALVVRGRVSDTKPTAMFDPGKPSYKLGISEIKVGWKPQELKVEVLPDKKTYMTREAVSTKIKVKTAYGKVPPKGSEVALAVVDEGLLELKPNESWKLLDGMMRRKSLQVQTSTAQMMVVGKRHFGRKALPHGGGGGRQLTRELFDTLVYWKGMVALDENGEASVNFPLNDSLTSFRIVAVANGSQGLFGTGQTSIRTTQDLMLLSGLPPLAREGDKFRAGITVRNASQREMKVEIKLAVKDGKETKGPEPVKQGLVRGITISEHGEREGEAPRALLGEGATQAPVIAVIAAGEAKEIGWEITVPSGIEKIDYEVSVKEMDGAASDSLKFSQKVAKAVTVRTFQATLTQVKEPLRMQVEMPDGAIPGRGGVNVILKPRLSEGLKGISEYMGNYLYTCLEQKLSKSVALRDSRMWSAIMAALPSYLDSDGLAKYFPVIRQGSDTLTSYLLSIGKEAGYEIPGHLKDRMLTGLRGFVEGRVVRYSPLPTADLSIRKMAAVEALSQYSEVQWKLLSSIAVEPNLWPTSALLDWINVLLKAKEIPDQGRRLKEAEQILRSRLNIQGATMGLSTERTDNLWWLMATPDTNAVKTLLTALRLHAWEEEAPRLAKGVLGRMKKGHWDTTIANAWGVLAMEKFSKEFESTSVTGITTSTFSKKTGTVDWSEAPKGADTLFAWPKSREALSIFHKGEGSPWAAVQSLAAIPLKQSFFSGFTMKKSFMPVEQKTKEKWSRGDVVRVRLELDAQADMTWVAVNDPIPAGSMILGSGLGRDSAMLSSSESERGWAWETFRERSFEALRVYYEYVPKGKWTVEYTLRLNNGGTFYLPETRVEALYSPEMFGEMPNKVMEVRD